MHATLTPIDRLDRFKRVAINIPSDPPDPKLPDGWPKPLPEQEPQDPPSPKEPPRRDPEPDEPPLRDPEPRDPPIQDPSIEPENPDKDPPPNDDPHAPRRIDV